MKLTETGRKEISVLAVDTAVLIALIAFLGYLVISLLQPFATILLWAVILAVAVYPAFSWLEARLGGRGGLAASIRMRRPSVGGKGAERRSHAGLGKGRGHVLTSLVLSGRPRRPAVAG